jgi:hypothetical protein
VLRACLAALRALGGNRKWKTPRVAAGAGDRRQLDGACLYSKLGETRRAVATLREAIAAGVTSYAWMKHDPDFDPIRKDPEFIELMQGH